MKTQLKILVLFLLLPTIFLGQNAKTEVWGDYFYLNGEYKKAISFFESYTGEKSLSSRRHWAMAYLKTGQKEKALLTYTPVVNSQEALVEDYYVFADLLENQPELAKEYREKAFRLPWNGQNSTLNASQKKAIDSLPAYDIRNLEGNTEVADFGMIYPIRPNDSRVFFLSKQHMEDRNSKVFKRYTSKYPIYDFYQAVLDVNTFQLKEKKPLRKSVNSYFQEGPGGVDPIRNRLYFTQSAKRLNKQKNVLLKLYSIGLDDLDKQTLPDPLNLVPQINSAMHPSISAEGRFLYFASDLPGGYGGMDLYRAVWNGEKFEGAENLGSDINTAADEVFPFSHRNGFLFYATNTKTGEGNLEIMMAHNRIENRWESFPLKQNINTAADDFLFAIDPAQNWAWFSSNRAGGKGEDDMYLFSFAPKLEGLSDIYRYAPSDTLVVALENVQKNDRFYAYQNDPLQRLMEREVVLEVLPKYGTLKLNANGTFWYKNQSPLQRKDSFAYRVKTVKGVSQPVWVQLEREAVKELPDALKEPLLPIYYALDGTDVLEQFKSRVDAVVALMKEYPDLEIELSSYTDCRGAALYNQSLSERRTQSIIRYVQERIKNPERIYGKGYGEALANPSGKKDYMLVAGSFRNPENIKRLVSKLNEQGLNPETVQLGALTRVVVAQSDQYKALNEIKTKLEQDSISTWITQSNCYQLSEAEHQEYRKTTFTVIRVKK